MKIKDKIAVILATILLAVTAIQGVSYALTPPQLSARACDIEVDKNPMTGKMRVRGQNPITIDQRRGDYASVFGDATIDCSRRHRSLRTHNRIAAYVVIEKWRPRYKKFFTYRHYAYRMNWERKNPREIHFPAARIICDGHGHYRVRAGLYTYESGLHPSRYPSPMIQEASDLRPLCVGTRHKPLGVVNNP